MYHSLDQGDYDFVIGVLHTLDHQDLSSSSNNSLLEFPITKKRGFNRKVEAALGLLRPCEFLT
jgi:hypothetical protein